MRDWADLKKNQVEFLEVKNKVIGLKSTIDSLKSIDLEGRSEEILQNVAQGDRMMRNTKEVKRYEGLNERFKYI